MQRPVPRQVDRPAAARCRTVEPHKPLAFNQFHRRRDRRKPRIGAVVAIGESAPEIRQAFAGAVPVFEEASMPDAVERARCVADEGDVVLLSPACASFDWYASYAERGDDFAAAVRVIEEAAR